MRLALVSRLPPAYTFTQARGGQLLTVAANRDELSLQLSDLLIQQEVGLVDKTNHGIGPHNRGVLFQPARIERPALAISQIRLIRPIFFEFARNVSHGQCLGSLLL